MKKTIAKEMAPNRTDREFVFAKPPRVYFSFGT